MHLPALKWVRSENCNDLPPTISTFELPGPVRPFESDKWCAKLACQKVHFRLRRAEVSEVQRRPLNRSAVLDLKN